MLAIGSSIAFSARPAVAGPPDGPAAKPSPLAPSPLIGAMQTELDRSFKTMGTQDIPAYFIWYTLTDTQRAEVSGLYGDLFSTYEVRIVWLSLAIESDVWNNDK